MSDPEFINLRYLSYEILIYSNYFTNAFEDEMSCKGKTIKQWSFW